MTRETRIGLLVAMAFVLTFGMVLSELTGKPSPASMRIRTAVRQVRQASFAPVIERRPVEDLSASCSLEMPDQPISLAAKLPEVVSVDLVAPQSVGTQNASEAGSRLIRRTAAKPETYTVKPGDSLCKIASNVYEDENRWPEILSANEDVLSGRTVVLVGQELVIPRREGEAPGLARPAVASAIPGRQLPVVPPEAPDKPYKVMSLDELAKHFASADRGAKDKHSGRIYVVRSGDNLTRIARSQLDDDSHQAAMKIFEANRDKLTSPDVLKVGMELQIPI